MKLPNAAIYARVSTQEQQGEGTSLDTQVEACVKLAKEHGYEVLPEYTVREVYSGLTTDRPRLQEVLGWIKRKAIQGLVIYSTDRFSRNALDMLLLMKECDINEVKLLCVSEDIGSGATGQLTNFIRGWASELEARRIQERTMRGKIAHAKDGSIPAGFGRFGGYFGLLYDKDNRRFVHMPGQIDIVKEILSRTLKGDSGRSITRDLQARGVKGLLGKPIQHSVVGQVLKHAYVYAGILTWKGIEIRGKIDPIITEEEAAQIVKRLRQNKEKSYGFGKRKWLTGRVYCEICGCRYHLQSNTSCHCYRIDKRSTNSCTAPRVSLKVLSAVAYGVLIVALSEPEVVIEKARQKHAEWERQLNDLKAQHAKRDQRAQEREKRRRLLSLQHEHGGLTDDEYIRRLTSIQKEADEEEAVNLDEFLRSEPPTEEEILAIHDRIKEYKPLRKHFDEVLRNPRDEFASQLAERVGLRVIIGPPKMEGQMFSAKVIVNLPIKPEEFHFPSQDECIAMVSTASSCIGRD